MFEENVERVRRAFEAFERRDKEAWLAGCDSELEIVPVGDWPDGRPIRGREAAWDFFVATDEPWEIGPFELTEAIEAGEDQLVARQRRDMRGKSSGVEVEYDYWLLVTLRDGKALRLQWFHARSEALKAARRGGSSDASGG